MKFRADLTHAYGASCVLHTALFADWGIQRWTSQFWRWSPSRSSRFCQARANCTFCEDIYWRKSTHNYSRNMRKIIFVKHVNDVTFQLAQPKELWTMILYEIYCGKVDTQSPKWPAKETESWMFKETCSKCLNQMDLKAFAAASRMMKPFCTFLTSLSNGPIRCGWLLTGRDQFCFHQISRVGSDCFLFLFLFCFSMHRAQSWLIVYRRSQNSL